MATRTTDQEWEHAVIGTIISVSLGGVLLGVFQLAEGESIGTIPLVLGCVGCGLFLYRSRNSLYQEIQKRIKSATTISEDDPQAVLRERYARGDIDSEEFNRRLQELQTSDTDNATEQDESSSNRKIISKRN